MEVLLLSTHLVRISSRHLSFVVNCVAAKWKSLEDNLSDVAAQAWPWAEGVNYFCFGCCRDSFYIMLLYKLYCLCKVSAETQIEKLQVSHQSCRHVWRGTLSFGSSHWVIHCIGPKKFSLVWLDIFFFIIPSHLSFSFFSLPSTLLPLLSFFSFVFPSSSLSLLNSC